ncbi:MAG: hypothetical protein ACTHLW_14190 [Verrucomicrobiota bacterium]
MKTRLLILTSVLFVIFQIESRATDATNGFQSGLESYRAGQFAQAERAFQESANQRPSSGALQNLGLAQWVLGRPGEAVIAWEQALWLNPFNDAARNNLRFARETAQLDAPDLTWYEFASGWLPASWWAWLAGLSLWLAVGALTLPGVLRWRRTASQQAIAAIGLGIFLLSLPAHFGTLTRSQIGFVLRPETALRLTPTARGEVTARLAAGEPARKVRSRGNYVFVRTPRAAGWVEKNQFKLVCGERD